MSANSMSVAPAETSFLRSRWLQLIVGIIGMVAIANLQYGWTLFVNPLAKNLKVSTAEIQVAFTLFVLAETWLVPFEGYIVDRTGPRLIVAVGGVLVGLAWIVNAYANTLTMLYVGAILAGIGGGIVYGTTSGNALKWFPDKRGLAAGLTAAGYGAGAALTVIPIANMIQTNGYQAAFLTWGIIQGVVVLACSAVLRAPRKGELRAPKAKVQQSTRDYTWSEMIRTPSFWLLYVMFTLIATGGLMATAQRGPIATDFKIANVPVSFLGLSMAALPLALSLDNIMNGITRPLFGWISDHIGRENMMFLAFTVEGFFIIGLVAFAANAVAFVVMSGLAFFAWGEIYSLFPATSGDLFGGRYATVNYGLLYTAKGTASLLVPIGSLVAGTQGNWMPIFVLSAVFAWAAALLALFVLKPLRMRHLAREQVMTEQPVVAPASGPAQ